MGFSVQVYSWWIPKQKKMQLLDTKISYFKRCSQSDTPDATVTLRQFLTSKKIKERVLRVRAEQDKARRDLLKKQLPAATVSCVCTKRNTTHIVQHSSVMAFDIDLKDNTHIANYSELREQLAKIVHVAYCGLSVSGTGYWGIIPVKYPEQHERHFLALEEDFKRIGIIIDPAPKSVVSLRIVSYDSQHYINEQAIPYERLYERKETKRIQPSDYTKNSDIAPLLSYITANGIDITDGYEKWIKCAFALAGEYGEAGRDYFHTVSQQHPKYDEAKTDKKYDNALKNGRGAVTMGSFIHLCKEYNVPVGSLLTQQPQGVRQGLEPVENHLSNIQLPPGRTLETLTLPWGKVTNEINANEYPAFWDN